LAATASASAAFEPRRRKRRIDERGLEAALE
jgi:hypothetical protein